MENLRITYSPTHTNDLAAFCGITVDALRATKVIANIAYEQPNMVARQMADGRVVAGISYEYSNGTTYYLFTNYQEYREWLDKHLDGVTPPERPSMAAEEQGLRMAPNEDAPDNWSTDDDRAIGAATDDMGGENDAMKRAINYADLNDLMTVIDHDVDGAPIYKVALDSGTAVSESYFGLDLAEIVDAMEKHDWVVTRPCEICGRPTSYKHPFYGYICETDDECGKAANCETDDECGKAANSRRRPIYIALTTYNSQMSGYNIILAAGHGKKAVREAAYEIIGDTGRSIYADTEFKNMVVVSRSKAKRLYGFDFDEWPGPQPYDDYRWIE